MRCIPGERKEEMKCKIEYIKKKNGITVKMVVVEATEAQATRFADDFLKAVNDLKEGKKK
jgi:hypothetical protein